MVGNTQIKCTPYHEFGHIFDFGEDKLSSTHDFKTAYEADRGSLRADQIADHSYYLSYDRSEVPMDYNQKRRDRICRSVARAEAFAELLSERVIHNAQKDIKEVRPNAKFPNALVLTRLLPTAAGVVAKEIADRLPALQNPLAPFRPALLANSTAEALDIVGQINARLG